MTQRKPNGQTNVQRQIVMIGCRKADAKRKIISDFFSCSGYDFFEKPKPVIHGTAVLIFPAVDAGIQELMYDVPFRSGDLQTIRTAFAYTSRRFSKVVN